MRDEAVKAALKTIILITEQPFLTKEEMLIIIKSRAEAVLKLYENK